MVLITQCVQQRAVWTLWLVMTLCKHWISHVESLSVLFDICLQTCSVTLTLWQPQFPVVTVIQPPPPPHHVRNWWLVCKNSQWAESRAIASRGSLFTHKKPCIWKSWKDSVNQSISRLTENYYSFQYFSSKSAKNSQFSASQMWRFAAFLAHIHIVNWILDFCWLGL